MKFWPTPQNKNLVILVTWDFLSVEFQFFLSDLKIE